MVLSFYRVLAGMVIFSGVFASAGPVLAEEQDYAMVRNWRVFSAPAAIAGGDMCYASTDNGQVELRIGSDGGGWLMGMPYYEDGNALGEWSIEGRKGEAEFYNTGDGWAYMNVSNAMYGSLHAAGEVTLQLERGPQRFSLSGSSAALTKVEECIANGGRPPKAVVDGPSMGSFGTADGAVSDGSDNGMIPEPMIAEPSVSGDAVEDEDLRMGKGCPKIGTVVSVKSKQKAKVTFKYKVKDPIATKIYWLDFKGKPVEMAMIGPDNPTVVLDSFVGHSFIAKDFNARCYGKFFQVGDGKNVFTIK